MKIVSYRTEGNLRAGVLTNEGVIDAWQALGRDTHTAGVRELLEQGLLDELTGVSADPIPLDQVEIGVPLPNPDKIICIGLNYRSHAEEAGLEPPPVPTFFAKFRNALVPDGATVELPAASDKVDYEAEVAFVIGKRAHRVAEPDVFDHIAGYTLLNDLSARDLQFATPQWIPGKIFDGSAPCGPALVTPDEAGDHDGIEIALTLNGEQMQAARTDDLIFSVPALIAHLSTLCTLEPGDIISTGTPSGVGSVRKPRVWLQDGDEIVVESPTLGRLTTQISRG